MRKLKLLVIGLLVLVVLVLVFGRSFLPFSVFSDLRDFTMGLIEQEGGRILTSDPLFGPREEIDTTLTVEGTIEWTNRQRTDRGLSPLDENQKLNASAQIKVEDMFDRQYFAHDSPTGEGVGDIAESISYEYVVIGENLALGNFENDEALVQAWMDSPGHRENILNEQYEEIGIAVMQGEYEGRQTWMAVQHFGKPRASCDEPSDSLKNNIQANKNALNSLKIQIENKRKEIEDTYPKRGSEYEQKVEEYNALVAQYNSLIAATENITAQYNEQVRAFNECAQGN